MKKINYLQPIILFTVLIFTTGCPEEMPPLDGSITINNKSSEDIIWCSFIDRDISTSKFYWGNEIDYDYVIESGKSGVNQFNTSTMKSRLKQNEYWNYYLLNLDSVRIIPWERIKSERIWLKEVTFTTWEEMEACGFTISYP